VVNLKIEVNKTDLHRIQRALDHVVAEAKRQQERVPMMCASDFKFRLVENLLNEKFKPYAPYSPDYAEWKQAMVGSQPVWKLDGDLLNNIDFFKIGDATMTGYFSGIRAGVMDGGGKSMSKPPNRSGGPREIAKYAWANEKKRPLFRPTHEEYKREGHSIRGQEALFFIKNRWR